MAQVAWPGQGARHRAGRRQERVVGGELDGGGGRGGGPRGNERLTAAVGAVLLALLAVEGMTILSVRRLFFLHAFVGMLLLGPLAVKLASTVYRFGRYYTGSAAYRRKGPPHPVLRAAGPVLVASTLGVFGSGVALLLAHPARGGWLVLLHKGSFLVWFAVMTVHVLGHLLRLPQVWVDWRPAAAARRPGAPPVVAGAGARRLLLLVALAGGVLAAAVTTGLDQTWAHWLATARHN